MCTGFPPAAFCNHCKEFKLPDMRNLYERERLSKFEKKSNYKWEHRVFKDWRKIEDYQLCDNISDINVSDYSQDHIYIGTTPVKQRKPSLTQ